MSQVVNVNFKLDKEVKNNMELVCKELGLSLSSAFSLFARKVGREKRIPFEVSIDPFYSKENLDYLEEKLGRYKSGTLKLSKHDLIED